MGLGNKGRGGFFKRGKRKPVIHIMEKGWKISHCTKRLGAVWRRGVFGLKLKGENKNRGENLAHGKDLRQRPE